MKITTLIPWFGGNRILAETVGKALEGCTLVTIPFCGGMPEVPHIKARTVLVNDLHRHLINLGAVVGSKDLYPILKERVRTKLLHPDELLQAQRYCKDRPNIPWTGPDIAWAANYFVSAWMSRNGEAGTKGEFDASMSIRYTSSGGDSLVRYRNAVASLDAWHQSLLCCSFSAIDAFVFLSKTKDQVDHGLYCDPPWPDDGAGYRHSFTTEQQTKLADQLAKFEQMKVVVRYGDHPLIRKLYPESHWTWQLQTSRTQGNNTKSEVLLIRRR